MTEIVYKELSYRIIGVLFDVYKHLGYGHREIYYQRAIALGLSEQGMNYEQEKKIPLSYKGKTIGKVSLDFLIENKIILEIKVANMMRQKDIEQILEYMKTSGIKLGIVAWITKEGVRYRRLVNLR